MNETANLSLPPDVSASACLQTPVGHLILFSGKEGLKKISHHPLLRHQKQINPSSETEGVPLEWNLWLDRFPPDSLVIEACRQLTEYFEHKRKEFDLPLDLSQGTHFQQSVWKTLAHIPFGQTISYKELAILMGDRHKIRAVGTANGKNPLPLFLPCHRVIGSDGSLTGFAWGLNVKEILLRHEKCFQKYGTQLTLMFEEEAINQKLE